MHLSVKDRHYLRVKGWKTIFQANSPKKKAYQKKIVNQKAKQDETVIKTIKEYQKIKEEFENHPLVVNYLYLKKEVDEIIQSINSYINGQLLK